MIKAIEGLDDVTVDRLTEIFGNKVASFDARTESSNWSSQIPIDVRFADGSRRAVRLKICAGRTFGPSEVEYYARDYVDLPDAPLVKCWSAVFSPGIGYHILLDDLAGDHTNRRDIAPNLEYGLAVAAALGRLHRHHWQSQPAPSIDAVDRHFDEIRPGVEPLRTIAGIDVAERFAAFEAVARRRLADPRGMSLLHGDLNSMNILTPKEADQPVYFIDRQPFDWSLTYGVAVGDLAYCLVLWWPEDIRAVHERDILQHWHKHLDQPDYDWDQAVADWKIAVQQCLNVPLEWCSKPETATDMQWLWRMQLARVESALESCGALS